MKSIVKQRDSWLYRYLTKDFMLFGMDVVSGRRDYYLNTTCDIRKAFISITFKRIIACLLLVLLPSILLYVTVAAPIIFIASWLQTGIFLPETDGIVVTFAAAGALVYAFLLFVFVMDSPYGYEMVKTSKPITVIRQVYDIVKNTVCSKVEWK